MAKEAEEDDVMSAMTLKLVRKICPIESGNHVEPAIILGFTTDHALVFPVSDIEAVVIDFRYWLGTRPSIWFEFQSDGKGDVRNFLGQVLVNVPLGLLRVAVGEELVIRCYHLTILVDRFFAGVLFYDLLSALIFLLHFYLMLVPSLKANTCAVCVFIGIFEGLSLAWKLLNPFLDLLCKGAHQVSHGSTQGKALILYQLEGLSLTQRASLAQEIDHRNVTDALGAAVNPLG
jgi:hypothetical protein